MFRRNQKGKMRTKNLMMTKTSLALALAAGCLLPFYMQAGEQVKGAQKLQELKKIETTSQADALKPGDQIAMVCAKCKSMVIENVGTEKGHVKTMTPGEKHLCPGCNSTIEVTGAGKGKKEVVKHHCGSCGDSSAFCCATKPGDGMTEGMKHN